MSYTTWRDAVLVHAKAAALAADSKWTDVAIGLKTPTARCVRLYYGGEGEPPHMGEAEKGRVLNGQMIGERLMVVAFWPLTSTSVSAYKAIDNEMYDWKHELRTRLQGDSQLGGTATDLDLEYAEPDIYVFGGARFVVLMSELRISYTEYQIGA